MLYTYNIYVFVKKYYMCVCICPYPDVMIALSYPFYLTYFVGEGGGIERGGPLDSQDVCISSKWRGPKTHPNIFKKNDMFFFILKELATTQKLFLVAAVKKHMLNHTHFINVTIMGLGYCQIYFCSNIVGFSAHEEMIQFDEHICSDGLVQPPTSYDFEEKDSFWNSVTPWPHDRWNTTDDVAGMTSMIFKATGSV